jgi:hypothetical protein
VYSYGYSHESVFISRSCAKCRESVVPKSFLGIKSLSFSVSTQSYVSEITSAFLNRSISETNGANFSFVYCSSFGSILMAFFLNSE